MKTLRIGDAELPQMGQGSWQIGDTAGKRKEELAALRRGIDLGLTVIDTAEMYGSGRSESLLADVIAGVRERLYLVSKVLPSNGSAKGVVKSCDASLKRLGVDRLDLYLLHWRGAHPLAETVAGFEQLRREGKIRDWGVSNFDVRDMEDLAAVPDGQRCAANQVLYNPEYRGIEFDLLHWSRDHDVCVMAYSPVGQGGDLLRSPVLQSVASRHGVTPAQVALAWCMRQPVLAIPKAGSVQHVEENAAAADLVLTADDLAAIDKTYPAPRKKERLATL